MKNRYIKLIHILFWTVTLISTGLEMIPSFGKEPINVIIEDYFIYAISYTSIFYSFYFFISVKYLGKEYAKYLIIFGLIFTMVFSAFFSFVYIIFVPKEIFALDGNEFFLEYSKYFLSFFETNFIFALSGSLIKIVFLWYESTIKQKEIEKQLIIGELALLKAQINPDFLIGTLIEFKNRIEHSPNDAIFIIENLSEIMSYMLYETRKEYIELSKEISLLNNYFFLYKTKLNSIDIKFNVTGNIMGKMIPPLILMTFSDVVFNLENVFSDINEIFVNLMVSDNTIQLKIGFRLKENASPRPPDINVFKETFNKHLNILFDKNYLLEMKCDKDKYYFEFEIENIPAISGSYIEE
jgi:two-component system, LytTR family, sensor kinase